MTLQSIRKRFKKAGWKEKTLLYFKSPDDKIGVSIDSCGTIFFSYKHFETVAKILSEPVKAGKK